MRKVIFWDIGNVLLEPIHGKILNDIFENRKKEISEDTFKEEASQILNKSFSGEISLDETWNQLFNIVNINNDKCIEKIKKIKVNRNTELIDYIKENLKDKYEMGIISDLSQIGFYVVKKYFKDFIEICNKEKIFISVCTNKTKRKNQENYFKLIKKKYPNEEFFFIDDEMNNLKSAQKTGFKTILFEANQTWGKANEKLIKVISNL